MRWCRRCGLWRLAALQMGVRRKRLAAAERDAMLADLAALDIRTDPDTDLYAWSGTIGWRSGSS